MAAKIAVTAAAVVGAKLLAPVLAHPVAMRQITDSYLRGHLHRLSSLCQQRRTLKLNLKLKVKEVLHHRTLHCGME